MNIVKSASNRWIFKARLLPLRWRARGRSFFFIFFLILFNENNDNKFKWYLKKHIMEDNNDLTILYTRKHTAILKA